MGLDMYLSKYPRYKDATPDDMYTVENFLSYIQHKIDDNKRKYTFEEWCGLKLNDINLEFVEFYSSFYEKKYPNWDKAKQYGWYRISDEIGYWRKANAIHYWFVKNVQNDVDDCGCYEVCKNQLENLLSTCKRVKEIAVLEYSLVSDGVRFENGQAVHNYVNGKVIANKDEIAAILPSCGGFFFGSTDYDEYYMQDIEETINILEKVLAETDFDKYVVYYHSSW